MDLKKMLLFSEKAKWLENNRVLLHTYNYGKLKNLQNQQKHLGNQSNVVKLEKETNKLKDTTFLF